MPRHLTESEKEFAAQNWPNLNVNNVQVTGAATATYNCLAWTLGITNSWVWPWRGGATVSKAQFDQLYANYGYSPAGSGPVAVYGFNPNDMQHGSLYTQTHRSYESKCGSWLRITHTLQGMEGGSYGDVEGFYSAATSLQKKTELMQLSFDSFNRLSAQELKILEDAVLNVDPALRASFEKTYREWKATWEHPLIVASSNPYDRTRSVQFLELIALGSGILPLLINQLLDQEEFFALQAVDRLLKPALSVVRGPYDDLILMGEQGRALETVKRWIHYNS
jgi:hypothetical protein